MSLQSRGVKLSLYCISKQADVQHNPPPHILRHALSQPRRQAVSRNRMTDQEMHRLTRQDGRGNMCHLVKILDLPGAVGTAYPMK